MWFDKENPWRATSSLLITFNKCEDTNTRKLKELFKQTGQMRKAIYPLLTNKSDNC